MCYISNVQLQGQRVNITPPLRDKYHNVTDDEEHNDGDGSD